MNQRLSGAARFSFWPVGDAEVRVPVDSPVYDLLQIGSLMPRKNILRLLEAGDRRTTGRSDQIAALVSTDSALFSQLIAGLWSDNPLVRMRAADAVEKVTRTDPSLLQPYKKELLGLMAEASQQELRWHVAAMVPRLRLNKNERHLAASTLNRYLEDRSSIVRTFALQGLADLAQDDPELLPRVVDILREATRTGTPAVKARSRKLLSRMAR